MTLKSTLHSAFVFLAALDICGITGSTKAESSQECVVLIHGLGRSSLSMKWLEWNLTRAGYKTVNVSYPSRKFCVEALAENYLQRVIALEIPSGANKIHFVTHSMGGIVLRQYLSNHSMTNLGSVVMLAPPNQGSELADYFKGNRIGRWILGPAGCELGTAPTDLPKKLGAVDFDLGVMAGNRSLNSWFSRILPGEDDGKVSVESTKVEGMKEFLVVENSHTWMAWRRKTVQEVLMFLKNGCFTQEREESSNPNPKRQRLVAHLYLLGTHDVGFKVNSSAQRKQVLKWIDEISA